MEDHGRLSAAFAHAILEALPQHQVDLANGVLPPAITQAALEWAMARVRAYRRPAGAMTAVLASWQRSVAALTTSLGRPPSVSELAKHHGKSKTAAHDAIQRLKAAKLWPGQQISGEMQDE